jgi:hypothetical protein
MGVSEWAWSAAPSGSKCEYPSGSYVPATLGHPGARCSASEADGERLLAAPKQPGQIEECRLLGCVAVWLLKQPSAFFTSPAA